MTSPSEPRTPSLYHAGAGSALTPLAALGVLFAGIASVIVIGSGARDAGLPVLAAVAVSQLVLLAIPLVVMRRLGLQRRALGLRRPPGIVLLAAVLVGCTAWLLNVYLVSLLPFEEGHLQRMNTVVDDAPLVVAVLVLAVLPAVCEEVLFRGTLQRALATRLFPIAAIGLTALMFALYHMSLIQLLPTFTLGVLLGVLAHRADSVVPAMLAHVLNNTVVILVARRQPAVLADTLAAHPTISLVGCAIATTLGVSLLIKAPA